MRTSEGGGMNNPEGQKGPTGSVGPEGSRGPTVDRVTFERIMAEVLEVAPPPGRQRPAWGLWVAGGLGLVGIALFVHALLTP